jgi:hypothetical protein
MKKRVICIYLSMLLIVSTFAITAVANEPPSPPSINGPNSGRIGIEYTYTFLSTDPEGSDLYYYIDWGDGQNTEWIGPYPSREEIKINHAWEHQGTYTIYAKAKDTLNAESDWSWFEVTIVGNNPPSAPNIDGPTSGNPGIEYNYSFLSTDPDGDDVFYFVDWGDGTVEYWNGPHSSGEIIEIGHEWPYTGVFNIKAKAKDTYDAESDWSDFYKVFIGNKPPNAPTIDGPSSGKVGKNYKFTVNAVDPNDDDVRYIIDMDDDTIININYKPSGVDVMVNYTWRAKGNYTIKAKAVDTYGAESNWSEFEVEIPRNRNVHHPIILILFERFPNLFPILQQLLRF